MWCRGEVIFFKQKDASLLRSTSPLQTSLHGVDNLLPMTRHKLLSYRFSKVYRDLYPYYLSNEIFLMLFTSH